MSSLITTGFLSFEMFGTLTSQGISVEEKRIRFTLMRRSGQEVQYLPIVAFRDDRVAELAIEMLKDLPGVHVHVRGDIRPTSWLDKATNQQRHGFDFVMRSFTRAEPDAEQAKLQSQRYLDAQQQRQAVRQQAAPQQPQQPQLPTDPAQMLLMMQQMMAAMGMQQQQPAAPAPTPMPAPGKVQRLSPDMLPAEIAADYDDPIEPVAAATFGKRHG